ncbi:MAG TPA: discoidin domain-containing protein [Burkholderiaceae bacterium]|nr:discoidin domain-containing protein [Burkholderiaceae bacterium]
MTPPAWAAIALVVIAAAALPAQAQERVLDDFADPSAWTVSATDDVKASLRAADGARGRALCIDYDFGRVTGYVTAQRALPIEFPARYEFTLGLRGQTLPNAFQFKLVDASGANVWWGQRPEFRFPAQWQTLKFRQRQIEFAWGPIADRTLRRSASVELVIASGSGAGKGSACFDRLTLRELPPEAPPLPPPKMTADALGVDFGAPREFGALALRWRAGAAARYAIELSNDGTQWQRVREVERARGELQRQWLPESEARFVRIVPQPSAGPPVALAAIEPLDAPSANLFFAQLAQAAPRGAYPRAYRGEQSYWTVLGVDGGRTASLLSEDGVLEALPGIGALEPFLVVDGHVLNWADARITHSLRDGDLPMPAVHWTIGDLTLDVEAFGAGTPEAAQALARYTLHNAGTRTQAVTLALAWRPFQANPPTQFLAHPGGASEIASIAWDGRALAVDGVVRLQPLTAPSGVQVEPLAAGPVGDWLRDGAASVAPQRVADAARFASGVLRYEWRLAPGERREVAIALPVSGTPLAPTMDQFAHEQQRVAAHWRERLDRVRISGPHEVDDIARTLRSALGHILVNRSGPALQPGARAYARSWIRDGALTSSALLRLGHADEARDFLRWFAPFQFKNGKVPCCATARGADPVPENDSDGEFAFAVADHWHYTRDEASARALWPHVRAAVAHMEGLRQSERTEANRTPERAAYFGLMPPSISHEGYSDKAAYSYWDDFWAAIGYRSAVELAQALGLPDDAKRIAAQRDEFLVELRASIDASTRHFGLDVLPGAADRGDVDPTSSTIALSPGGLLATPPSATVRNTFERYWRDFEARRADEAAGVRHGDGGYTPYEWRNVGALVRLGERERALQALAYFYRDRRPAGWNQWAEVVLRDPREPRFLGDMPHGWVASDQIRSVLDLFAYEDEGTHALVLAAGVPLRWFDGTGLRVQGLRTPYGALSWQAHTHAASGRQRIDFELRPLRGWPAGGVELRGPWPADARVWVDGRAWAGPADAIRLSVTPARVRIEFASTE